MCSLVRPLVIAEGQSLILCDFAFVYLFIWCIFKCFLIRLSRHLLIGWHSLNKLYARIINDVRYCLSKCLGNDAGGTVVNDDCLWVAEPLTPLIRHFLAVACVIIGTIRAIPVLVVMAFGIVLIVPEGQVKFVVSGYSARL